LKVACREATPVLCQRAREALMRDRLRVLMTVLMFAVIRGSSCVLRRVLCQGLGRILREALSGGLGRVPVAAVAGFPLRAATRVALTGLSRAVSDAPLQQTRA
jgi:hypothetical protein